MVKLTEKQKRFCDYYIETGNGSEAARRAGYKAKNLNVLASQNLTKSNIKEYVDKRIKDKDSKRIASQDEILEYFTRVMRGEEQDTFTSSTVTGELVEERVFPSLKERTKAAESLAKRYGLDKVVSLKERQVILQEKEAQDIDSDIVYEIEEPTYE